MSFGGLDKYVVGEDDITLFSDRTDDFVPDFMWIEGYDPDTFPYFSRVFVPYEQEVSDVYLPAEEEEEEGEVEEEEEEEDKELLQAFGKKKKEPSQQEQRRRSLFVHSSPTQFPDVNRARKSVFGSIFLRTLAQTDEEVALLKSIGESSFSMLQSLLSTLERIISSPKTNAEKKTMAMAYKDSLIKNLEVHGIAKVFFDGSVHWNIYPIMRDYLFSLEVGSYIHQTRYLSNVEDRIVWGLVQKLGLPYEWSTGSVWAGSWDSLGMAGFGIYRMLHGVSYDGKLQDGMFHGKNGTLTYLNQFKALHCVYEKGVLLDCQFQFPDLLLHEKENWQYCQFPDRRFWTEVKNGLKPAKIAQKKNEDPPRVVPKGCYDTNDGFYDPVSLMLVSSELELLRIPVCKEDKWIKKYCRKGFPENANFRPDLFENWFDFDQEKINSILEQQDNYRKGKIDFDELQQFYVDMDLCPLSNKYQKRKTESELELEEILRTTPSPRRLVKSNRNKNPDRHKIPGYSSSKSDTERPSHSSKNSKTNTSEDFGKTIKIDLNAEKSSIGEPKTEGKRKIPEKWLKYQPVLKPPFDSPPRTAAEKPRKKCPSASSSSSSSSFYIPAEEESGVLDIWRQKNLEKYMKSLIVGLVTDILLKERERHKKRLNWARKPPENFSRKIEPRSKSAHCMKALKELFNSIPDKAEYCDSDPTKVLDLKEFAEDKYNMLQYWGMRMFSLDFDEPVLHR